MDNQEENPEMHIWFRFSMWFFSSSVTAPAALTQPKWSNLSKRSKKTDQISDQILPQVLSLSTNDGPPLRDQNTHWVELCWLSRGGGCMHKWSLQYFCNCWGPSSDFQLMCINQHSFSLFSGQCWRPICSPTRESPLYHLVTVSDLANHDEFKATSLTLLFPFSL